MSLDIRQGKGFGYKDEKTGKICQIRCFACGKENYAMAVASGGCAWCGYNPNKKVAQKVTKVTRGMSPLRPVIKDLILDDKLKTAHKAFHKKHGRGA